jgi:flagellar basal-body rod protein FlgB
VAPSCFNLKDFLAQVLHCEYKMAVVLDNLYSQENYLISKKLLDATHLRHEALSNNIANVETPGFKRRDLPKTFSVELRRAVDRKDFTRVKGLLPRSAEDRQAKPVRMDGNTVQIDEELLAMNRNALNYEYLTGAVGGSIKELNTAIRGRI